VLSDLKAVLSLNSKAGCGKTFLVNAICNRLYSPKQIACITGSTTLSVILYERERTTHSMFGIPTREGLSELGGTENSVWRFDALCNSAYSTHNPLLYYCSQDRFSSDQTWLHPNFYR